MGKKFFMMVLLAALIAVPFTSVASACNASYEAPPNFEDLLFEGDLKFDYGSTYSLGLVSYSLDLLGLLTVSDVDKPLGKLGKLSLNASKTSPSTYDGHWVFLPSGYCGCCGCELGTFDLSLNSSGEVSFILQGFNEVLGIEGEQRTIFGSLEGGDGNTFTGSMVPIPGAVLLFGSGLLGLICIRRK